MSTEPEQPYGLAFGEARSAGELDPGQIVVLDGHVVEVEPDPDDPERVRLVLVRALGPPPGTSPDQREIELTCPSDMVFGTARPHNVDLAPPPPCSPSPASPSCGTSGAGGSSTASPPSPARSPAGRSPSTARASSARRS